MAEIIYRTAVERVLIGFAERDAELLAWLQRYVAAEQWRADELQFSIEALYSWACALADGSAPVAVTEHTPLFLAFRRQLYQRPTNTELQRYGVQVQVCDSRPQQRGTPRWYALRRVVAQG